MKMRRTHKIVIGTVIVTAVGLGIANHQQKPKNPSAPPTGHMKAPVAGAVITDRKEVVCVAGYTRTVRPPASYTTGLKVHQLAQFNYKDRDITHYEEDHLVPLELGGDPTNPQNLWPQPWPEAKLKDVEENALHQAVCSGKMSLVDAQHKIVLDWK